MSSLDPRLQGPAPRTLLLAFIHGFKGDDQTFGYFPLQLSDLLAPYLPHLTIRSLVYPAFDTRGDLVACVSRFRDWLTERVIDAEVARGTAQPMLEPGTRVVLVGHSMGGIVAAEAVLALLADTQGQGGGLNGMFPAVQGVLALDTPYLGISPGVVRYGAEDQWTAGKAWYEGAAGLFAQKGEAPTVNAAKGLPKLPEQTATGEKPGWAAWGKYAAVATVASAAVAGAGAAAYMNRAHITTSLGWATSHLEFVGCLARGEELKRRLVAMGAMTKTHDIGFANVYTDLGARKGVGERTFCNLPKESAPTRVFFHRQLNEKVGSEVEAHMNMFSKFKTDLCTHLLTRESTKRESWIRCHV